MGAKQRRSSSEPGQRRGVRSSSSSPTARRRKNACSRITAVALSALGVLLVGPVFSVWGWTQDAGESKAAQKAPPAPTAPGGEQDAIPPPPAAKQKAIPPAPPLDEPKDAAPAAPDDTTKAAAPADDPKDAAPATVEPLSLKYRFVEKYSLKADPDRPWLVTQYRVGVRETSKYSRDNFEGGPTRSESSRQTIYTERPAELDRLGDVTAVLRRYDKVRVTTGRPMTPLSPPLLEGMTIWYKRRPDQMPLIMNLTPNRPLREIEYGFITEDALLPQLALLLPPPTAPKRVGDTWPVSRVVAHRVWNELPHEDTFEMTASLVKVYRSGAGSARTAVIGVSGRLDLDRAGSCALNAQLYFTFDAAPAVAADASGKAAAKAVGRTDGALGIEEARGQIDQVLMSVTAQSDVRNTDGQLKQNLTREVVLRRKPFDAGEAAGLDLPEAPPIADEVNSWVLYDDPLERFHFRHPQGLILPPGGSSGDDVVELTSPKIQDAQDVLAIVLEPKTGNAEFDRLRRDPEQHRRDMYANWKKLNYDVVQGSAEWLPDADWAPLKRRVYRLEAALKTDRNPPRLYSDTYLVLFTGRTEAVELTALTKQDPHLNFRTQAEGVIKSFEFGPSEPQAKAAPARASTKPDASKK
jgi:hypothetical protein